MVRKPKRKGKRKPSRRCAPVKLKKRGRAKKAQQLKKGQRPKKCRPKRRRRRAPVPAPMPPVAPPPGNQLQGPKPAPTNRPPPVIPEPPVPAKLPLPPGGVVPSPILKFSGSFGVAEAERLLWRAAFGPAPGQAEELASKGLDGAVLALTRPQGDFKLTGPAPMDSDGNYLYPGVDYGHDQGYWLDRMLRSSYPVIERMAMIFHDWFATCADIVQHWDMTFAQTNVFRKHALGSFHELVRDITSDPAMILFLDQNRNARGNVNENYARELMELFTLGADRGAYTESDVREVARALTGWWAPWNDATGWGTFQFQSSRHDAGSKTIFGRTGAFDWDDVCTLIVENPFHATFFVSRLWSYFIPTPPSTAQLNALAAAYVASGYQVLPVLEAILTSHEFYTHPRLVKPPVVYLAGLLRARGRYVDDVGWQHWTGAAGQQLYFPPDVAGWDEQLWLNPDTMKARWHIAAQVLTAHTIPSSAWATFALETPEKAVDDALAFWSYGSVTPESQALLLQLARDCDPTGTSRGNQAKRVNALRMLVPALPDYQTC